MSHEKLLFVKQVDQVFADFMFLLDQRVLSPERSCPVQNILFQCARQNKMSATN